MSARRPSPKRRRRAKSRFYLFVAIVVLAIAIIVLAIVFGSRGKSPSNGDPTANASVAPAQTDEDIPSVDIPDPSQDTAASSSLDVHSTLAEMLGSEDAVLSALPEDQRVKVSDLSITPGLSSEWKNILLLGTDERTLIESSRTDAMLICSINSQTGEVKLTSILRDMAVDFNELGENAGTYRINSANYFGGPELAMKKINECLGMNIEDYVTVNFFGFQEIAHALGGIDIDITEAEMHSINELVIEQGRIARKAQIDDSHIPAVELKTYGENTHLDGRQSLAYARIRKLDSDISRTERQRIVLKALMEKLKGKDAMELSSLALTLQSYVKTNLSIDEILSIAITVLSKDLTLEQMYLPAKDTYTQETRNGQAMLYDCDWGANSAQLHAFIYE